MRTQSLKAELREHIAIALLDAFGLAVASARDASLEQLLRVVGEDGVGADGATRWHDGARMSVQNAVLVNSVGVHGRFQDDTDMSAWSHPGSVIVPVAVALTELRGGGLDNIARSLAGGYAALSWLGGAERVSRAVVSRGFRAGPTLGTVASAVAGAIALGADERVAANAIGIAADSAGGTLEPVRAGSDDWRIQHGSAAWLGALASRLAFEGMRGPEEPLAGDRGWLSAFAGTASAPPAWGKPPNLDAIARVWQKAHPTLGDNMALVVSASRLHSLLPDTNEIASVEVRMNPHFYAYPGTQNCGPFDYVEQALASTAFNVALALCYGDVTWDNVRSGIHDPLVYEVASRVVAVPDDDYGYLDGSVEITAVNGTIYGISAEDCPPQVFFRDREIAIGVYRVAIGASQGTSLELPEVLFEWASTGEDVLAQKVLGVVGS